MKAVRLYEYGPPSVLRLDEDVPRPVPGPRDLLVAVHATSVNPVDTKIRQGTQRAVVRRTLPAILGLDVSGVVEATGAQVTRFAPGDEIFASPSHRRDGTYAEYTLVDEGEAAKKPANLTHGEAASLPLVALTAWDCLRARVSAGDKVLIQAGSGGVGTAAIQLAKHLGATVATTCSTRNVELVRGLGADEVVDYTKANFWEVLEPQDLALDALGGPERRRLRQVVRRGGRLVSINSELPRHVKRLGPWLGLVAAGGKLAGVGLFSLVAHGVRLAVVVRKPDGAALAELGDLVERGILRPVVDRTFGLHELVAAHEYSESGRARGKIVVAVRG